MSDDDSLRTVTLRRSEPGRFVVTNVRGGTLELSDEPEDFSPTELLLAALGGCAALDVAALTERRAEPESFEVVVTSHKVKIDGGNALTDLAVTFRTVFPEGPAGDAARGRLPIAIKASHDRLCTVSRTVELGTPVDTRTST